MYSVQNDTNNLYPMIFSCLIGFIKLTIERRQ